jgi:hypothetical protein
MEASLTKKNCEAPSTDAWTSASWCTCKNLQFIYGCLLG